MDNIFLTKSNYCQCVQCEKILWLNKFKKEILSYQDEESSFEEGRKVGELAKGLFGDYENVPIDLDVSARVKKTGELLDKPNVIAEASFLFDNNFCSVDILKNDSDGVEIYEVKSSTKVKDIY